jgi:hypothetical protein
MRLTKKLTIKMPSVKPNTKKYISGFYTGILDSVINKNYRRACQEKPPISAGRGGKHYSKGSKYAQFK